MREIAIYKPDLNRPEAKELSALADTLWDVLETNAKPIILDREVDIDGQKVFVPRPCFIINSIKVERDEDDNITAYDTSTEPYAPITNRYIMGLLIDNILEERPR